MQWPVYSFLTSSFSTFLLSQTTANGIPATDKMRLIQKIQLLKLWSRRYHRSFVARILCCKSNSNTPYWSIHYHHLHKSSQFSTLTTKGTNHNNQKIQQNSKLSQYCFKTALKDAAVSWKAFHETSAKTWDTTAWILPSPNQQVTQLWANYTSATQTKITRSVFPIRYPSKLKTNLTPQHNPVGLLNQNTTHTIRISGFVRTADITSLLNTWNPAACFQKPLSCSLCIQSLISGYSSKLLSF